MKPTLLVLDQWASTNTQVGTSKNWLYNGFAKSFDTRVENADTPFAQHLNRAVCLFQAFFSRPADVRREYHRQLEWAAKTPVAFKARTARFQKMLEQLPIHDAIFQIGCLFGPMVLRGQRSFSYHDQTVAMVERDWPEWLPRHFSKVREQFLEMERASLRTKDLVFTYSEVTRQSMIRDYELLPEQVMVAPTACKIPYPSDTQVLATRMPKLLFVSTDFSRKGGDLVFEAFRELRRQRAELELVLVGGPAANPLPDGARHLGMVSFPELMTEYLSASLLLHPARHDAYPNVLKEALACGLPAVTSASAGIPEIVTNGKTGIVLQDNTVPEIVEAVHGLLADPDGLWAMREKCLLDRDRFRPETCVSRITEAILGTMSAKGGLDA